MVSENLTEGRKAEGKDNYFCSEPWRFLAALEVHLYTLAKAGSYQIHCPEKKQNTLCLDYGIVLEHLAQCKHFVLQWSTRHPPASSDRIMRQVVRLDMLIRNAVARESIDKTTIVGRSLTSCWRSQDLYAKSLWAQDLHDQLQPQHTHTHTQRGKGQGQGQGRSVTIEKSDSRRSDITKRRSRGHKRRHGIRQRRQRQQFPDSRMDGPRENLQGLQLRHRMLERRMHIQKRVQRYQSINNSVRIKKPQ